MIQSELLKILVCPETKAPLVLTREGGLLSTDPNSRRLYRVEDDIPILLVSESTVLSPEEHASALKWAEENPAYKAAKKVKVKNEG